MISGTWGQGSVDYLVEAKDAPVRSIMVGVGEAMAPATFELGFPRNVAQIEATLTSHLKHDCYSKGKLTDLFIYGIATDSDRWEFHECQMKAESINTR
ncbi:hypothetical protein BGZ83_002387, partial [Gryganskiella cystojenkinii]